MMKTSVIVLVSLACAMVTAKTPQLPSSFQRCSLSDPNLNDCLRDAVQGVIPEMVKGVPALGVYSIDPLNIIQADIGASDGPVSLNLDFKNLEITGLRTTQVVNVSYDPATYRMKMEAKVAAPFKLDGDYKIAGKVLVLPIQGEGKCTLSLENVTAHMEMVGREVRKGSVKYMEVDDLDLKFDTSRLNMKFDNLFNGNKALGENMNRFLNENWRDILKELKPSIENTFGATFQAISNRIFLRVPYNNVFLP